MSSRPSLNLAHAFARRNGEGRLPVLVLHHHLELLLLLELHVGGEHHVGGHHFDLGGGRGWGGGGQRKWV